MGPLTFNIRDKEEAFRDRFRCLLSSI